MLREHANVHRLSFSALDKRKTLLASSTVKLCFYRLPSKIGSAVWMHFKRRCVTESAGLSILPGGLRGQSEADPGRLKPPTRAARVDVDMTRDGWLRVLPAHPLSLSPIGPAPARRRPLCPPPRLPPSPIT